MLFEMRGQSCANYQSAHFDVCLLGWCAMGCSHNRGITTL